MTRPAAYKIAKAENPEPRNPDWCDPQRSRCAGRRKPLTIRKTDLSGQDSALLHQSANGKEIRATLAGGAPCIALTGGGQFAAASCLGRRKVQSVPP